MIITSKMSYAEWVELADEYYLAARSLQWFSCATYPATHAGHHALELYLKAITIRCDGTYDNQQHDIRKLYEKAKSVEPNIESSVISAAIDKYWNYDLTARYTSQELKPYKLPSNGSMGTDSLSALDSAVSLLRDIDVITRKGLDRLVNGETELTLSGLSDPHLSLNSVILFHFNDAFRPKKPEVMDFVRYLPPSWNI